VTADCSNRTETERCARARRTRRVASCAMVLTFALAGLAGCQSSKNTTGTPTQLATTTTIPMLTIVTPTPAVPGNPDATAPAIASTPTPEQSNNGENGTYTVQPGDTRYTLAVKFNITVQALMEANSISDPTSLQAGQVIVVPR
jgi:LysM repeat protein